MLRTRYARRSARADEHARKFVKCSIYPETYSKLEMKSFGAFFNFDARVRIRHDARARAYVARTTLDLKLMYTKFGLKITFR